MSLTFPGWLAAQHPQIPQAGAQAILALAEGGATVPFIARYRKEQTGNLDEVAIRAGDRRQGALGRPHQAAGLHRRGDRAAGEADARAGGAASAGRSIPWRSRTSICRTSRSGRRRRRRRARRGWSRWPSGCGRAGTALADAAGETPDARAAAFVDAEKGVADATAALAGAGDIVIERLSEDAGLRRQVRDAYFERGFARVQARARRRRRRAGSRTTSSTRSRSRSC